MDAVTDGFESVKNETGIKLLAMSAASASLLSLEIVSVSQNPFNRRQPKVKREQNNKFRHAVLYSTENNLANTLLKSSPTFHASSGKPPKLCFIVTCQGSQYPGMGSELYGWNSTFRHYFDACDAIIEEDYGFSVKSLMNANDHAWMANPLQALPYILALQYGLVKLWESWGVKPDIVLGMSFGEYGAAVISGIISLRDAMKLIMTRTKLVTEQIQPEAFGIIELDVSEFPKVLEEMRNEEGMQDAWLDIGTISSPQQTCVVGLRGTVHKFLGMLCS